MSMNKAERAEMEALRTKLALRWSGLPEPERLPLPEFGNYVNGWFFYTHGMRVFPAWTEENAHGEWHRTDDPLDWSRRGYASQNSRAVYATKRDAYIALRLAVEQECAKRLRDIDRAIEAVSAEEAA